MRIFSISDLISVANILALGKLQNKPRRKDELGNQFNAKGECGPTVLAKCF